jgi:hypothetical protein
MNPNELLELLKGLEHVNSAEDMGKFLKEYNKKQKKKEQEKSKAEEKEEKYVEYSSKMAKVILGILIDKTHPQHIDINELSESDNGDQFAHALANIMPAVVLDAITDEDRDDEDYIDRHTNYLRLIIKYAKSSN